MNSLSLTLIPQPPIVRRLGSREGRNRVVDPGLKGEMEVEAEEGNRPVAAGVRGGGWSIG